MKEIEVTIVYAMTDCVEAKSNWSEVAERSEFVLSMNINWQRDWSNTIRSSILH